MTDPNWIAVRFTAPEAGAIFFHCHINLHNVGGMAVALLQGMDKPHAVDIPPYYVDFEKAAQARRQHGHGKRSREGSQVVPGRIERLS